MLNLQKLTKVLLFSVLVQAGLPLAADADTPTALNQVSRNPQTAKADALLDMLHLSAAAADWDSYFNLFTEDAGFIGTDITEHWTMGDFQRYARSSKGWSYETQSRTLVRHGDVIVFDEILDNKNYGLCRGTGTLILTEDGWKILQYHMSFPIPNALAPRITDQIKIFRKKAVKTP